MKKYFLSLMLFLVVSGVFAQEYRWGVKAGLNVANIGPKDAGYSARLGYHFGGFTEAIITPFFSIQPELVYSLQGASGGISSKTYLNYHYINVPLLAKAYFYQDASIELGIQYGFLVGANFRSTYDNITNNITKQVKRNDFALVIGTAYKLGDHYNFSVRYNFGISDTADQNVIVEQRATNRVLQVSIGYIFGKH